MLTEQLAIEGVGEAARAHADSLAVQYWEGSTMACFLRELGDILPLDSYCEVLAFCRAQYPELFAALPSDVTSPYVHFQRAQLSAMLAAPITHQSGKLAVATRLGPKSEGVYKEVRQQVHPQTLA